MRRNPFQGGMGFFTQRQVLRPARVPKPKVAIPFRVGWGFSLEMRYVLNSAVITSQSLSGWDGVFHKKPRRAPGEFYGRRNPFQGGMGFFTPVPPIRLGCKPAAAFRQPQVCPPKTSKKL